MRRESSPKNPQEAARAARRIALRLLARREHSASELREKLIRRGNSPALADNVLTHLIKEDHLSESRFAEAFCQSRFDRGYGPIRIEHDLGARGVPVQVIGNTLAMFENRWMARLSEVHRKRFQGGEPRDAAERARRIRFLLYRGFTLDQIGCLFRNQ